jgi:UDP-GlcNAc3NAcA epimerase
MKIVTVLGARPQFIKASIVSHAIHQSTTFTEVVVHTGQHFDTNMSDVFFSELSITNPTYHLDIHGGTHGAMTGRMLMEIERVLLAEKPDVVLVYGDTNSTLAGALASVKLHIPVAHVEAGLRSFNMMMPEEVNRILTDHMSRWLFTPTDVAAQHLAHEGFDANKIFPVGDVMYDVALHHGAKITAKGGSLQRLNLKPKNYILVTIHRAENTDHPERMAVIIDALETITEILPVVWPLHPRTRAILQQWNWLDKLSQSVTLIQPVGYLDMVQLEKYASLIATDSGGVQKEAFFYQVPCVTLRDETEWVELVEGGWNRLTPPTDANQVLTALRASIGSVGRDIKPYGAGDAAQQIVKSLSDAVIL